MDLLSNYEGESYWSVTFLAYLQLIFKFELSLLGANPLLVDLFSFTSNVTNLISFDVSHVFVYDVLCFVGLLGFNIYSMNSSTFERVCIRERDENINAEKYEKLVNLMKKVYTYFHPNSTMIVMDL